MTTTPLSGAHSRRILRRLFSACLRDLAFYRYCGERIHDHELSETIRDIVQVREHLAAALAHAEDMRGTDGSLQAERLGAIRGWETSMRARLARNGEIAYLEEIERIENELLERVEDATLDPQLSVGARITLERHLALVHTSQERALSAGSRIRSRRQREERETGERHAVRGTAPASLTRAMSSLFFFR